MGTTSKSWKPLENHENPLLNHGNPLGNHGGPLGNHRNPFRNHGTPLGKPLENIENPFKIIIPLWKSQAYDLHFRSLLLDSKSNTAESFDKRSHCQRFH